MKEQLIDLKTAKLAKEKGFNWRVLDCYNENGEIGDNEELIYTNYNMGQTVIGSNTNLYSAPPQSLLQKWLRDVHNIHVYIDTTPSFDTIHPSKWKSLVNVPFQPFKWTTGKYYTKDSYEEALETGLQEALKLIK